ncbi:uncharacterized protein BCR38DRAFT_422398 [Pseudomassariella vexata]|uniref:Uncharacterized protein n=1 Tax=Pseudomassariella vexata TaxID=1141098 RepID=A0A1Y2E9I4_9PEZI|nr:uncharacterized protein BCR38DRAFT_422398 [Pseudomassariella vexata]ORY68202.1 hypothetical protein BCR38DRAFT_422398 [Pseudomassariella vexata]
MASTKIDCNQSFSLLLLLPLIGSKLSWVVPVIHQIYQTPQRFDVLPRCVAPSGLVGVSLILLLSMSPPA